MYEGGMRDRRVLSETLNIPLRTVHSVVKRIEDGEGIERKVGSGRGRIWGVTEHRRLGQLVRFNKMESVSHFMGEMTARGSVPASRSTVWRELHRQDYVKSRGKPSPLISAQQKQQRTQWCLAHSQRSWENVFFSDESSLWLYPNTVKIWTKSDIQPLYVRPKHSAKFHVWGAISSRGTTPLCIFQENLTSQLYTDILEGYLLPTAEVLYPDGWVFQQDNDPKHRARHSQDWLNRQNVTVLPWPSYSPDLNPIENVWGLMKNHLAKTGFRNIEQLQVEAEQYWMSLSHNYLQRLTGSMNTRIQTCLENLGSVTGY